MADMDQVTGAQTPGVTPVTPEGGGVPAGTPAAGTSDASGMTVDALLAKLKQAEEDRRNVQAVKDREVTAERKRVEELARQLDEIKKQGMTEQEKIAYERDQLAAKVQSLETQAQQREMMQQYGKAYTDLGVDASKLDYSSPEALATSGWQAVAELISNLKNGTPSSPAPKTPPQNNSKVITGSGGVPRTKPTMSEMMAAVGAKTPDDFYRWAERHPEAMNQWLSQD